MAAPSYVDAGTGATDAGGAWSYTCEASAAAGRVFIVQILQDGTTTGAVTSVVGTNIENLAGTDNTWTAVAVEQPVGSPTAALQSVYIGRALSTSAPTISGANSTSEDLYIRSYQFTDVSTGTTLATVIENSTAGSTANGVDTSAAAADTAVTTLGADRLALNFVAVGDDNVIQSFQSETGGDWTLAVAPYAESSGTDGAIGLQIAYPAAIYNAFSSGGALAIFGATGTNEMQAQSFASPGAQTVQTIQLYFEKTGTPSDNLIVEIQTDSGGVPSGTVVGTGATVAASSIVHQAWARFAVNAPLSASTTYWIVARRSGSRDTANHLDWLAKSGSTYAGGVPASSNSGTWTAATNDFVFGIETSAGATIDGGNSSITDIDASGVVGFALIGTTPSVAVPRYPAISFQDPAIV